MTTARTVRVGDRPVRYRTLGREGAPRLVMCHGLALSHRDLLGPAQALSDRWRVLLWDMPGHGASRPGPARHSLEDMARALDAVMTDAGVERPVLFGFSFGGMVAQAWMRRRPRAAAGLVAYGCLAPFSQTPPVPRWLAGPIAGLTYGPKSWNRIRDDFAHACALTDAAQRTVRDAMAPLGKPGFIAVARALLRGFERDPAFGIDCPLLVVRGERDANAALLDQAQAALLAMRPDARTALIPDAGHCAHLDRPNAFARALLPFLDGLNPPSDAGASRSAGR